MSYHKTNKNKVKKRTPKKISKSYLHNYALYYLERFSASKKHFIFIMKQKVKRSCQYHSDQDYNECIKMVLELADKFESSGLLNDDLYTYNLVLSLRRKGMSRNAIINKAYVKGINREKTVKILDKLDNDSYENQQEAEIEAALKFAKKKRIGPYFNGDKQDIKRSLGILARAGFSYETAKNILDMDDTYYN